MTAWIISGLVCFSVIVSIRGQLLPSNQLLPSLTTKSSPKPTKYTTRATQAPVPEKGQPPIDKLRKKFVLTSEQITTLKGNCAKKAGGCKKQSDKAKKLKEHIKSSLAQDLVKGGKLTNPLDAAGKATKILEAVFQAKKALYDTAGLSDIEPEDNGLVGGDMQLNEEQAQYIINEVTGKNPPPKKLPKHQNGAKEKRSSVSMESFPSMKWAMPIRYAIGKDISYNQAGQVRTAIAEIQRKTCIKFVEDTSGYPPSPYIIYRLYTNGGFCGQSPVGNQGGVNTVWLNFGCDGGYIKATIIHETMHSLGVHHEHVRVDRDDYITVDWNNIDPQSYDLFDGRPYINSYSSYGVPYDYYSVMHYHAYVSTVYAGRANMIPKTYPNVLTKVIGQRVGMSDRDAELLRKMYCMPDCNDYHVYCGWWATQNYCYDSAQFDYMRSTCPKSCGFCPEGATT